MRLSTTQQSNRQQRREVAKKRIPEFADELQLKLDKTGKLTPRDVWLLYNEHRQMHGCPSSMPNDARGLETTWATNHETWSNVHLLLALRGTSLEREQIVYLAAELWRRYGESRADSESSPWRSTEEFALA